jgi:hypothetical protein
MEREPWAYLWDMQKAADAIGQFTAGLDSTGYEENHLFVQGSSGSLRSSAKR